LAVSFFVFLLLFLCGRKRFRLTGFDESILLLVSDMKGQEQRSHLPVSTEQMRLSTPFDAALLLFLWRDVFEEWQRAGRPEQYSLSFTQYYFVLLFL
jgi:hypothetical protein